LFAAATGAANAPVNPVRTSKERTQPRRNIRPERVGGP
jgi:hypothetical protein